MPSIVRFVKEVLHQILSIVFPKKTKLHRLERPFQERCIYVVHPSLYCYSVEAGYSSAGWALACQRTPSCYMPVGHRDRPRLSKRKRNPVPVVPVVPVDQEDHRVERRTLSPEMDLEAMEHRRWDLQMLYSSSASTIIPRNQTVRPWKADF
jgi:hypothetical protein